MLERTTRPRALRAGAALAVLLAAAALAACGSNGSGDGGTASTAAGQATSKTLVVDTSAPMTTMEPSNGILSRLLGRASFDTLTTFKGSDVTPVPSLATRWEASADGRSVTFELRDDVKFADGTPLTSADVAFTLRRLINLRGQASAILVDISDVRAAGPHTVVLSSKLPNVPIAAIVAHPALGIINSKLAKQHGATDAADAAKTDRAGPWLDSGDARGAGSGPYAIDAFEINTQVVLARNDRYWGPPPAYQKVVVREMPNASQSLSVQQGSNEVAISLGAQDLPTLEGKGLRLVQLVSPNTFNLFLNVNPSVSATSANEHIRRAVRAALDYDAILALAGGKAEQPSGNLPNLIPGTLPPDEAPKHDLGMARSEIAASGIANPSLTLYYVSDSTVNGLAFAPVAQKIQANLAEAGIRVQLAAEPAATFLARWFAGRMPFGIITNNPTVYDPSAVTTFAPGGQLATPAGWPAGADGEVTSAVDEAQAATGEAADAAWQKVQRLLNERGPYIGFANATQVIVASGDVSDMESNPAWAVDLRTIRPS